MNRMTLACMGGVLVALVAISTRAELAPTVYQALKPRGCSLLLDHSAADPRTARVFDDSNRAHTDQFILRFRKPL